MANNLTKLKINEVSFCKRGMNQHARISLYKSADTLPVQLKKYYGEIANQTVSRDFKEILAANEKNQKLWEAREELYPLFDALNSSVSSIVTDTNLSDSGRTSKIDQSVSDFLEAVKSKLPELETELTKFFNDLNAGSTGAQTPVDGEVNKMTEAEMKKAVEEAVAKATAELSEELAKAKKEVTDLKAMEAEKKKKEEMAKSDETVVISGQTLSKSAVGEATFAILKAQEDRLAKAEEAAELAKFEKKASDEFKHIPGTDLEKAALLKSISKDAENGPKIEALLKSLEAHNAKAFETVGVSKGSDAAQTQEAKVAEIVKRDNVSKARAMEIAVAEAPELFK